MVWRDPWLPDVINGYVRTLKCAQLFNIKVSSLMRISEREWVNEVIEDLLEAIDSDLINRIPLSMRVSADSWYWLSDNKGEFTVKSYYMSLQGKCIDDHSRLWKRIRALKLPSKVKNLVYRLCKGCLLTNALLLMRYVRGCLFVVSS